jgi:signal transduction histidine kinase
VTTSQQQELVMSVCSSSRYLLRILNDVLLFSQSDAEKLQLESVSLDIGQTIIEVYRLPWHHSFLRLFPKNLLFAVPRIPTIQCKFSFTGGQHV